MGEQQQPTQIKQTPNIILAPIQDDTMKDTEIVQSNRSRSRSESNHELKVTLCPKISISGVDSDSLGSEFRKAIEQAEMNKVFDLPKVDDCSSDFSSSVMSCSQPELEGRPLSRINLSQMQAALGAEPVQDSKDSKEQGKKTKDNKTSEFMKFLEVDAQMAIQMRRKSSVQFRRESIVSEEDSSSLQASPDFKAKK
jgi:hypothetical protein